MAWSQLYKNRSSGKSILRDYFQENRTSRRPFLLLRNQLSREDLFLYNSSLGSVGLLAALPRQAALGKDHGGGDGDGTLGHWAGAAAPHRGQKGQAGLKGAWLRTDFCLKQSGSSTSAV